MTPATASEPYWAPAPSRSTSMRLTAFTGMDAKSTATAPTPTPDSVLKIDVVCTRLPLISTRIWSGLRPRSCATRTWSALPELDWSR